MQFTNFVLAQRCSRGIHLGVKYALAQVTDENMKLCFEQTDSFAWEASQFTDGCR